MTFTGREMIAALRSAQTLARTSRAMTCIIIQNGRLKAVTRPGPNDVVLIKGIVPSMINAQIKDAAQQAFDELRDAIPAIERALDIIDKDGAGKPRASQDKAEMLDAVLSCYEDADSAHFWCKRKDDIFIKPPIPKESFWTRFWGI